jgi:hypothetical protein
VRSPRRNTPRELSKHADPTISSGLDDPGRREMW